MKAFVREAGKPVSEFQIVNIDIKYRSAFAKHFIGEDCYAVFVALNEERTLFMCVDEDGHLKQLPFNLFIAVNRLGRVCIDPIVGKVVFLRIKPVNPYVQEVYDYEVVDITQEDYEVVMNLLDPRYQYALYEQYKLQIGEE